MNEINEAIKIADQLQKDIEKYFMEQNKIIKELKETLESYAYPDMRTPEQKKADEQDQDNADYYYGGQKELKDQEKHCFYKY